jgi:hypothetical protein
MECQPTQWIVLFAYLASDMNKYGSRHTITGKAHGNLRTLRVINGKALRFHVEGIVTGIFRIVYDLYHVTTKFVNHSETSR